MVAASPALTDWISSEGKRTEWRIQHDPSRFGNWPRSAGIQHGDVRDVYVIAMSEASLTGRKGRQFRHAVKRAVQRESQLLVDVKQVSSANRALIKSLAYCLKVAEAAGGELRIASVTPSLRAVLELVGFHHWASLFETRSEALQSLFADERLRELPARVA